MTQMLPWIRHVKVSIFSTPCNFTQFLFCVYFGKEKGPSVSQFINPSWHMQVNIVNNTHSDSVNAHFLKCSRLQNVPCTSSFHTQEANVSVEALEHNYWSQPVICSHPSSISRLLHVPSIFIVFCFLTFTRHKCALDLHPFFSQSWWRRVCSLELLPNTYLQLGSSVHKTEVTFCRNCARYSYSEWGN